eukprot:gnl/Spiro4/3577_TR1759_c0_g1_i1.p1 gnl/Spiro4/3577_TR1759_c0_g1~~gnl/Spiro4/3577_TR1759_c0_g1_i1.p1  ORF type:complete len:335 (-),score=72.52 gnl/Spiro4/3577_TR1759_c0_g1_i1:72-1076(-)
MSCSSGIRASPELLEAFRGAGSANKRLIKIGIRDERFCELDSKQCSAGGLLRDFELLQDPSVFQDAVPCFVVFQLDSPSRWCLMMYVPDGSRVQDRMLFASSRDRLKRDLGASISFEMFGSHRSEFSYSAYVHAAETDQSAAPRTQREYQIIHETSNANYAPPSALASSTTVLFPITDKAQSALKLFASGSINFVCLMIQNEQLELQESAALADDGRQFHAKVAACRESRFFLYRHSCHNTTGVFFVFLCPESSTVRVKMTCASARAHVLSKIEEAKIALHKRMDISSADDVTDSILNEELVPTDAASRPAMSSGPSFQRPSRPGRKGTSRLLD